MIIVLQVHRTDDYVPRYSNLIIRLTIKVKTRFSTYPCRVPWLECVRNIDWSFAEICHSFSRYLTHWLPVEHVIDFSPDWKHEWYDRFDSYRVFPMVFDVFVFVSIDERHELQRLSPSLSFVSRKMMFYFRISSSSSSSLFNCVYMIKSKAVQTNNRGQWKAMEKSFKKEKKQFRISMEHHFHREICSIEFVSNRSSTRWYQVILNSY